MSSAKTSVPTMTTVNDQLRNVVNNNATDNSSSSTSTRFGSLRTSAAHSAGGTKSAGPKRGDVIEVIPGRRTASRKDIAKHFPNTTRALDKTRNYTAMDEERHKKAESLRSSKSLAERLAAENRRWKNRVEAQRSLSQTRTEKEREEQAGRSLSASQRRRALIEERVNQLASRDQIRAEKARRAIRAGTNNHCPL